MKTPENQSSTKSPEPNAADAKLRKEALQVTKEIVVKFIETQRVSPSNFEEIFPAVHRVVCRSIAEQIQSPCEES